MRAFQPKGYTCMHLHSVAPSQRDIHDKAVRFYIYIFPMSLFLTHAPVFEQRANHYTRPKRETRPDSKALRRINISHIYIHMFLPQSSLLFFPNVNPLRCLYYHTYADCGSFHQSKVKVVYTYYCPCGVMLTRHSAFIH